MLLAATWIGSLYARATELPDGRGLDTLAHHRHTEPQISVKNTRVAAGTRPISYLQPC